MPYKITIEKIEAVTTTKRGEHTVIAEVPWTDKELMNRSETYYRQSEMPPLQKIYGYAPSVEVTEQKSSKVLEQTVEEIDMAAVIKAINKI